jgi:hypothetical protein
VQNTPAIASLPTVLHLAVRFAYLLMVICMRSQLNFRLSKVLLVSCLLLVGCTANPTKSKQELAKELLAEIGIAQKYDMHFASIIDMAVAPASKPKFDAWLQGVLVQGAGWKHAEAKYIARLEADFSEAELQELLNLSKQPLMKKLLQSEVLAYGDVGKERRKLLFQVWDDYNSGKIEAPKDILR